MLGIKAITQSRHTSRDLIELYTLFASVCKSLIAVSPIRSLFFEAAKQKDNLNLDNELHIPSEIAKGRSHTSLVDKHGER